MRDKVWLPSSSPLPVEQPKRGPLQEPGATFRAISTLALPAAG